MIIRWDDELEVLKAFVVEFEVETGTNQEGPLWHYTDAWGLQGILTSRAIRATHYAHLNDSTELILGEETVLSAATELLKEETDEHRVAWLTRFVESFRQTRLSQVAAPYVASLCADDGNRLSQWRGYGAHGAGYSIAFPALPKPIEVAGSSDATLAIALVRMRYSVDALWVDACARFKAILDRASELRTKFRKDGIYGPTNGMLRMNAASLAVQLKHEGFKEEQEWRILAYPMRDFRQEGTSILRARTDGKPVVQFRPSTRGLIPYVEIPLAEDLPRVPIAGVHVGPGPDVDARTGAVVALLETLGYDLPATLVKGSSIPFKPTAPR